MASNLTPQQAADYHQSKQPAIVATCIVFLVICNVSVFVRALSQLRLSKRLFVDDFAIIFAALCSDVTGALYLSATTHGLGLHIYRVLIEDPRPPQHVISLFEALYLNAVLTGPSFLAIKVSLLWFYRRTFLVHQRWLLIAWWINVIYIVLWAVGSTLVYIFQCIPPQYYWQRLYILFKISPPSPIHGECNSATATLVALPLILSLISDIGILLLPVTAVSQLQMGTRKKIGLIALFSLGLLACVCEIVRVWLEVSVSAFEDPTYANVTFIIFTFAEGNIAIAAACLPLVASQWRHLFTRFQMSRAKGSEDSYISLNPRRPRSQDSTVRREDSITAVGKSNIEVQRDIEIEWGPERIEHSGQL